MDPTTVLPPSPEKSPPPQNPHTATDAIIDSSALDHHQKSEPSTSHRNMDNFRALVMKLAGRLFLPAHHQSLIGRRFDDIFPDELLVPDHPPYADMILTALWELNAKGGSSEEAISDFIKKEYHKLPWAHATMLSHHLRDLCLKGEIIMTHGRCYLRCSSITKPVPNPSPCPQLCLNDDSSCSSPISSSYSSSSASLCSSPSSSSSSFCSRPPYQRRKRQFKRKKKNIKETGRKMVQGRGRGRGRGRQLRTIRVGRQARRRGKPGNEIKIGEKSQIEEEQVAEDQNEVTGMEVEENAIQDGKPYDVMGRVDQEGLEDGVEKQPNQLQKKNNVVVETAFSVEDKTKVIIDQKVGGERNEQYQPQKQYHVTWIGRGEHIQGKGECVRQKESVSKQNVSKKPCEQPNEQNHQRKQYNVVWIGRGVRKLKGAGKNLLEAESDEKVTELEDYVSEDAEVDEHVEQLKPKEEKGAINVEHNRPEENHQSDIVEKQFLDKEQLMSVTDDKILSCERGALMIQHEVEARVGSVEKTEPENQHDCLTEEQVNTKEPSKEHEDATEPIHPQELSIERTEEEIQDEEILLIDEEIGALLIQHEVEARVETVEKTEPEKQHDCLTEEQVDTKEQSKEHEDATEPIHPQELSIERTEEEIQDEEILLIDEERGAPLIQYEVEARVETVEKTEPEKQHDCLTEEQVNTKEQPKEHEDATEPIHPQELCIERTEEEIQSCGPDSLKNGEAESPEDQPQQKEQHKKVLQEESELMNNLTAEKQDFMMIESESQLERKSVEHNEVEEDDDTIVGQVQPQKQSTEGTKEDQKDENEAGFEKNQPEECENGVMIQRYHPQEQYVERIEERSQPCIQQTEKNNAASNRKNNKHQDEQRRPLRQGLRSSCKKKEATTKSKNQLEQATPVRRSLRPRKTVSEATVVIENGPDHSKEQVKHSGRARPLKRKPGIAEAEQASKSQKTRKTDL